MSPCRDCGVIRPKFGRGLCSSCWRKHKKDGTLDDFERINKPAIRECKDCGETVKIYAHDVCRQCYGARQRGLPPMSKRCVRAGCNRRAVEGGDRAFRMCPQCLNEHHLLISTNDGADELPAGWKPSSGTFAIVPGSSGRRVKNA